MKPSSQAVAIPKCSPPLRLFSAVVTGWWMLLLLLFRGGGLSSSSGPSGIGGGVQAFSLWVAPSLRQYLATPTTSCSPASQLFGSGSRGVNDETPSSASVAPILVGTGLRTAARTLAVLRDRRGLPSLVASSSLSQPLGSTFLRSSLTVRSLGGLFASIEADDDDNDLLWNSNDDGEAENNVSASLVHEMATFLAVRLGKTLLQSNRNNPKQPRKKPLRQALPLEQQPPPRPPHKEEEIGVVEIPASTPVAVAAGTTTVDAASEPSPSVPPRLSAGSSSSSIDNDDGHHPRTLHQREGDRVLALGDDFSIESVTKSDASSTTSSSISSESVVTAAVSTAVPSTNEEVAVEAISTEEAPLPPPEEETEENLVAAVPVEGSSSTMTTTSGAPLNTVVGPVEAGPPPVPTAVSLDFGKPLEVVAILPPPPVQPEQARLDETPGMTIEPADAATELSQDPELVAPKDAEDGFHATATVENTDAGDTPESTFFALGTLTDLTVEGDEGDAESMAVDAPAPSSVSATEASPVAGSGFVLLSPPPAPAPSTEPERELAMASASGPSNPNQSPSSRDDAGASGFTKRRTSNATTESKTSTALSGAALLDAEVASITSSFTSSSSSLVDHEEEDRNIQDHDTMDEDIEQQRQILLESFRRSPDAMGPGTLDETEAAIVSDAAAPTIPTADHEDDQTTATLALGNSALDVASEALELAPDPIAAAAEETTSFAANAARFDEASVSLPSSPTSDTDLQSSSADREAPRVFVDELPAADTQPPKAPSSSWSPFGQGWKAPQPIEPELLLPGESELETLGSDSEPVPADASVNATAAFAVDGASSPAASVVPLPPSPVDDVDPPSWMSISIESEERGTIAESILPMDPRTFSSLTDLVEAPAPFDDPRSSMAAVIDPPASPLPAGSTKNKWNPFQSSTKAPAETPETSAGEVDTSPVPPVGQWTADGTFLESSAEVAPSIEAAADVSELSEPKVNNDKDRWNPYSRTATDAPPKSNLGVFDPWKAWMNTVVDGSDKSATAGAPGDGVSLAPASSKINYSGFGSKPRAAEAKDAGYLGVLRSDSAHSKPDVVVDPEPQPFPIKLADGREVTYQRVADDKGRGYRWEVDAIEHPSEIQQPPSPPLVVDEHRSEFSLGYRWTGSNWASSSLKPRMAKPPSFKDQDPMELHPLYRTESGGYVWYTIPKFPDVPQWRSFAKYSGIHWTHPEHEDIDSSDDANY